LLSRPAAPPPPIYTLSLHDALPIFLGGLVGLLAPSAAHPAAVAIHPVLALLLYVTFLGVPFARIGSAFADWRFLTTIFIVNFLRSEEHTSELQSRFDLVCRLLLEKK